MTPRRPYALAAKHLSSELLADIGPRWLHVQQVARTAQELSSRLDAEESDLVIASAWLHDIGYAAAVALTGLHSLDGALYLEDRAYPEAVVGMVAHHTGSKSEAEERGLLDQLLRLAAPPEHLLDLLTAADLAVGPTGRPMAAEERIAEILQRYEPEHPVHRAVLNSRESLLASVKRTRARLVSCSETGDLSRRRR